MWIARNKYLHEGIPQNGSDIACFITSYIQELEELTKRLPGRRVVGERWRSPEEDSSGRVLNFTMHLNEHIPTSFAVEAIACVQAIQLGLDLGIVKAEIEGDALLVKKKPAAMKADDDCQRVSLIEEGFIERNLGQNDLSMNKVDGLVGLPRNQVVDERELIGSRCFESSFDRRKIGSWLG
ncbi:hypothetical protein Gogos_004526, partial [Gossypium gossypioides]|nr:hypothetical protein [Gossypium gossypioides]